MDENIINDLEFQKRTRQKFTAKYGGKGREKESNP